MQCEQTNLHCNVSYVLVVIDTYVWNIYGGIFLSLLFGNVLEKELLYIP